MFGVNIRIRNSSSTLLRAIARRKAELLNEFGENTTRHAKDSMKVVPRDYRGSSSPGSPPLVRSPEPNLRTIRYRVSGDRVRVAPVNVSGRGNDVPGQLEHGGYVIQRRRNRRGGYRTVRFYVQPRPFMRPAGIKALSDLRRSVKSKGLAK